MTQRRCPNCKTWHDKKEACPTCDSKPVFNKWLATAKLNGHLNDQLNRVETEDRTDRALVKDARREQERLERR